MSFFKKLVDKITGQDKSTEQIERQQPVVDNEKLIEQQNIELEDSNKAIESHYERLFGEKIQDDDEYDIFPMASFEGLDIENGKFEILAINLRGENKGKHYYQDNQKNIAKFFSACKFEYEGNLYRCGYDYRLIISQNGQQLYIIMICFNCGDVIVNNSNNKFLYALAYEPVDLIGLMEKYFSVGIKEKYEFNTREEGIRFFKKQQNNPNLIHNTDNLPQWLNYEGDYIIWMKSDYQDITTHNQAINWLNNKVHDVLNHSNFHIRRGPGYGLNKLKYFGGIISSNKNTFETLMQEAPQLMSKNQGDWVHPTMKQDWSTFSEFHLELFYKKGYSVS